MMPILETCLTVLNLADQASRIFDWFTGVTMGDQVKRALTDLESTKAEVRRLSEHVLYSPNVQQAFSTSGPSQFLASEHDVGTLLVPLAESLNTDLLSTAVVSTPTKLRDAFRKDPWEVLIEVRPVTRAKRPSNPDLIPVIFSDSGLSYVGWQTQGAIPLLFGCDFTSSLREAKSVGGSGDRSVIDTEREILRVRAVKRFWLTAHVDCTLIVTTQRVKFVDPEDAKYSFELSWGLMRGAKVRRNYNDVVIVLPGNVSYEIGLNSEAHSDLVQRTIEENLL